LDKYEKIIYSPKIIYGLDSVMERPVYCYYKERTITPTAMIQQIARCRNITKLNFLFTKKKFKENENTVEDVKADLLECNKLGCNYFYLLCPQIINDQYLELLAKFEYNYECYRTNKFSHFIKLLDQRGFIRKSIFNRTDTKGATSSTKLLVQEKKDNFDKDDPAVERVNKILKVPYDDIEKYKDFFINKNKLQKHFNITKYLNIDRGDMFDIVEEQQEFSAKKIKQTNSKILFLLKIRKKLHLRDLEEINIKSIIKNEEKREKYFKEYNTIFRNRNTNKNFDTVESQQQYIIKMYDHLFGNDIIIKTRKTVNKKKVKIYEINKECLELHKKLAEFRKSGEDVECLFD